MLEIQKELASIKEMYAKDERGKSFNAIVYGDSGTGKSFSLRTCRRPVLVHSFDPGGQKGNRKLVDEGWFFVDSRWETEDPMRPSVFAAWDKEYHRLLHGGLFANIGTFVLDSATSHAATALNVTLQKAGRAGGHPFQQDYAPSMALLEASYRSMTTLPCDVVLIAHQDVDKDEASGRMFVGPLFIGKLKMRIPLLFDELYYAHTKESSAGVKYEWLTRSTGLFKARSRLAAEGKLETYEPQDFKNILRKAGLSDADRV